MWVLSHCAVSWEGSVYHNLGPTKAFCLDCVDGNWKKFFIYIHILYVAVLLYICLPLGPSQHRLTTNAIVFAHPSPSGLAQEADRIANRYTRISPGVDYFD